MLRTLKDCLASREINTVRIATGYWDLPGLALLADDFKAFFERGGRLLLLIGKDPYVYASQVRNPKYKDLTYPADYIRTDLCELEPKAAHENAVRLILDHCTENEDSAIEIRIFHKNEDDEIQFLHSKCYIFTGDFLKQKIVYPNMTKYMPFVYDDQQYLTNQKCFIITGKYVAFLTAFLNSSLFKFCFRDNFPELHGGTREMSKIFFDKIPVILVDETTDLLFKAAVDDIQREYTKAKAMAIDTMVFDLYGLTEDERKAIGFVEIQ